MQPYDHSKIEPKWQKKWEKAQAGKAKTPSQKKNGGDEQKKFFGLIEFPFPSGDGLHVGHIRSNTAMDIIARKRRREGYNVLYPIGWDAFGLPTENYAIKTGLHPTVVTKRNTDNFRRQLKSLGFSFDWSREVDTSDPKYYRWTQWIFLQLLKKGLAYKQKMFINWCPKDLIGLANEEVIDGKCERCGTAVEKREKEQWMLAITKYADRLDRDLDDVNFLEKIKIQQRNWIGKSEGAEITFKITAGDKKSDSNVSTAESVTVFTTRPDTLFGVTYIVLAPENKLVASLLSHTKNADEIKKYIAEAKIKSEIQRTDAGAEKTGVELRGITATNPANGEQVPVWIADYVLADYGTGAVMAVPAHDSRDFAFAKKYRLPIRQVIAPYFENTTDLIPKKDLPISKRAIVHAIVKHPSQDKYLFISWKDHAWNSLITGGIENNETLAEAGKREILEETGYKNARFIDTSGSSWEIHSYFYAEHKNENRYMVARGAFFQLENEECVEITEDEKKKHDIVWLDAIKARDFLTHINQKYIWDIIQKESAYEGDGKLINSGKFTGRSSQEILKEITEFAGGKWVEKFKLRDWIFSRQRYWGEPIPVIHCEKCGTVPVPEKNLPVKLPKVKNYKPTENGESPLAAITKWVNVKCPTCRGKARRETDTMPNWAGSSWYYLRYADPKNKKAIASPEALKYWTPVDWYNGGMEHTTLHLLYSRFWHKFLFDIGVVPTKEPYVKRTSHGLILAAGGEKMSKSKGNVINPDATVTTVGADSLRLYEMFMGPFDQHIAWDENGIVGTRRFIERVWRLQEKLATATIIATDTTAAGTKDTLIHKTIKKVSEDIEEMRFNTAISTMMIAVNELEKETAVSISHYENLLKLLAPFAPHVTEEIWQTTLKHKTSIHDEAWPSYDPTKIADTISTIIVQVNGKMRASFETSATATENEIQEQALKLPETIKWIGEKPVKKIIVVKGKVVNIVV